MGKSWPRYQQQARRTWRLRPVSGDADVSTFFVEKAIHITKSETEVDRFTSSDTLMKVAPDYYRDRFDAIADLRKLDDGTLHRGQEFRRVASLVNVPMWAVMKLVDPAWMKDKKKFYAWLDRHPEYCTYQRRGGSRPSTTFIGGKAVGGADGT